MHKMSRIFAYPKWLALAAGCLAATGFQPLDLWPVTLACFAILLHLIAIAPTRKAAFTAGWLFGVGHFVVGLNWIATAFTFQAAMPFWLGYLAVVLLSLYLAVFPALATLAAWGIARRFRGTDASVDALLILSFAGMWIVTEWMRSWVFTGFIWNPLGVVLLGAGNLTSPAFIGTYGMAAVVIILSGILWAIVMAIYRRTWRLLFLLVLDLVILGIVTATLGWLGGGAQTVRDQRIPITVVQPNIGQDTKWEEGQAARNFTKLADLSRQTDRRPRLIFWPEAAIPDFLEKGYPSSYYYPGSAEETRARLRALMNTGDVLMLGALKLDFTPQGKVAGARNSVFAFDTNSRLIGSYDKSHLVPYGEYLPMRPLLSLFGLSRLAPGDLDFTPGPGARNIDLGKFGTAGVQVCYEIIFSGHVVHAGKRPAFIFNPSNDAWFGGWGPPQHLAQAQMRAIEEGLPIIRSTPTGISAVIDADGRILDSIPMGQAGRMDMLLPTPRTATVFARYGNIVPLVLAFILLLSAVAIGWRRR